MLFGLEGVVSHALAIASGGAALAVATVGALLSRYPRTYSLPRVVGVALPAMGWSSLAFAWRSHPWLGTGAFAGAGISGLYYAWIVLGCPWLLRGLGGKIGARATPRLDVVVFYAALAAWILSAWASVLTAASI